MFIADAVLENYISQMSPVEQADFDFFVSFGYSRFDAFLAARESLVDALHQISNPEFNQGEVAGD